VVKNVCTAALNAPSSGNPDDEDDDEDDEDDEDEEGSGADMFVAPLCISDVDRRRRWMPRHGFFGEGRVLPQ